MRIVLLVVALALLGACTRFTESSPRIEGAPEVTVLATDVAFGPAVLVLPATAVNLTLKNDGGSRHDLTIPDLGVNIVAEEGQTVTAGLRDLKPGRYDGYCSMLGHAQAGMKISVTVR